MKPALNIEEAEAEIPSMANGVGESSECKAPLFLSSAQDCVCTGFSLLSRWVIQDPDFEGHSPHVLDAFWQGLSTIDSDALRQCLYGLYLHCYIVTLLHHYTVQLHCYIITLNSYTVTSLHCTVTLLLCCTVTLLCCYTVRLLDCYPVTGGLPHILFCFPLVIM